MHLIGHLTPNFMQIIQDSVGNIIMLPKPLEAAKIEEPSRKGEPVGIQLQVAFRVLWMIH